MILAKLKTDAEAYLGEPVTRRLSPCRLTSTTAAQATRTPAKLPAWKCCASSRADGGRLGLRAGQEGKRDDLVWTWAAYLRRERAGSGRMASSRSKPPTRHHLGGDDWISALWTGLPTSSARSRH